VGDLPRPRPDWNLPPEYRHFDQQLAGLLNRTYDGSETREGAVHDADQIARALDGVRAGHLDLHTPAFSESPVGAASQPKRDVGRW
jgi:hypothetical protein